MPTSAQFAEHEERSLLGLLILDGMKAMESCLRLQPQMFYLSSNAALYGLMSTLAAEGIDWELASLSHEVTKRKLERQLPDQWRAWIVDLTDGVPPRMKADRFVNAVISAWQRRSGAELCRRYQEALGDPVDAVESLSALQGEVCNVIAETQAESDPLVVHYSIEELDAFFRQSESRELARGLSYGNDRLDTWTMGMQPGEVTVVGARSGVGKSSLMCQALAAVCRQGIAADCFSLEMKRAKVLRRLWAIESGIDYGKIHRPYRCDMAEREAVKQAAFRVAEWPLRIHDRAAMPITEIVARARMSVRQHDCKLVIVDYAQIVHADGKDDKTRVTNVSRALATFAKDSGAHVMLLSQLRKADQKFVNHAPNVTDLRETGQIENDAHVIILLHRPWDDEDKKISFSADLLIPKMRDGITGAIQSQFCARSLTFK